VSKDVKVATAILPGTFVYSATSQSTVVERVRSFCDDLPFLIRARIAFTIEAFFGGSDLMERRLGVLGSGEYCGIASSPSDVISNA
jgi:hypothetical protein